MGEVYRARDTKLGRDVALKLLPESFTHDAERVARFRREAQILASLNHPHIGGIYGLEEAGGAQFLILEFVEGGTLADRLTRGRLPLDETVAIARQLADALEAAHEKGIIHRDFKPANIALTADGHVKVLDFGLARAIDPVTASSASMSPTLTTPAMMTGIGVILGTAAYMAPEQAKGRAADKRSDIWSFGCVLFEMLAGIRPFDGEDVSDVLATVLKSEPQWSALPQDLPPTIRGLVEGCLKKDRRQRIGDISTAQFLLTAPEAIAGSGTRSMAPAPHRSTSLVLGATAVASLAVGVAGAWFASRPAAVSRAVVHLTATPPGDSLRIGPFDPDVAISPDGRRIAYLGGAPAAVVRLYVRELDRADATELPGTDNARGLFFSPDGQWIGYFSPESSSLSKVSVHGGAPVVICRQCAGGGRGAAWGPDDTIVFTANGGARGLLTVNANGGAPSTLAVPDREKAEFYVAPDVLPGGAIVFTIHKGSPDTAEIAVFDRATSKSKVLIRGGTQPRYADPGFLVYATGGMLRAMAFDAATLTVSGNPIALPDRVVTKSTGSADFIVARIGTLAYISGAVRSNEGTLVWVDRDRHEEPLVTPARGYVALQLSPDGQRVAVDIRDQESGIWVFDIARRNLTRLTFEPRTHVAPVWTPDGKRIIFGAFPEGITTPFWQSADGTGTPERLATSTNPLTPMCVTPDGMYLIAREDNPGGGSVVTISLGADRVIKTLLKNGTSADVSPDGRWIAYTSNESGREEVYVRPYPAVESGQWLVSNGGGRQAHWTRDSKELLFTGFSGKLMAAPMQSGSPFSTGIPRVVLDGMYSPTPLRTYDVSPDGRRFLIMRPAVKAGNQEMPPELHVVLNWTEELKRLAAAQGGK
jgi:serine/threonine-protein kinase